MQYPSQSHTAFTLFLSFNAIFQSHGSVYLLGSITSLESSFQITTQETQLHSAHPHTRTHTSCCSDEPDHFVLHSEDSQGTYCYYLHVTISTVNTSILHLAAPPLSLFSLLSVSAKPSALQRVRDWKSKEPSKHVPQGKITSGFDVGRTNCRPRHVGGTHLYPSEESSG